MTTTHAFVRGVARSFAIYGGPTPSTRTAIDLRVPGLDRDAAAVRTDASRVGQDLQAAMAKEPAPAN
jgi:hypothetical protein